GEERGAHAATERRGLPARYIQLYSSCIQADTGYKQRKLKHICHMIWNIRVCKHALSKCNLCLVIYQNQDVDR
uniref:Uncharacterized protein n=1 Tax=Oryza brachyantha TaxID=4533 RepID=J3M3U0_ORYBR